MSVVTRTTSTEAVRSPSPPPARQLRPLPHRSPSSASTVVKADPPPRPPLLSRPSMSAFVSNHGTKTGYRFAVEGNCVECMARARDAYDKMHAEHLSAESKASGR